MRLSLQGYFDLGCSFGLGDDVFRQPAEERVPDIAGIGISNPLGQGIVRNLRDPEHKSVIEEWRKRAIGKVADPQMELGYVAESGLSTEEQDSRFSRFKEDLISNIQRHAIDRCELTIYAVGLVFVRLDHASAIPLEFLQGFHKCYEFAAYSVEVSNALRESALQAAKAVVGTRSDRLRELSRRPEPRIQTGDFGYRESKLFTGFSCLGLCVDETDELSAIEPRLHEIEGNDFKPLTFDYHGKLHFGWSACILEPRTRDKGADFALAEMGRMLQCIQIAHVFLGTCEAFEKLFLQETLQQVEGYVKGTYGRNSTELNRLRTLALAVISLTQYAGVAAADEDQRYFESWEEHAKLSERHHKIQQQCELLYNVQVAETQAEEEKRDRLLNRVVLFLTAFTFISVLVDSYDFIDYRAGWFSIWIHRAMILACVLLGLGVVVVIILRAVGRLRRS